MDIRERLAKPSSSTGKGDLIVVLYFAVVLVGVTGCGPKSDLLGVSGEVILDGAPVKSGSIQLTSMDSAKVSATGAEIIDGKFEIPQVKGLPPGKYHIVISAGEPQSGTGGAGSGMVRELIPLEYNANSQKTVDVTVDGDNHFVFDIKSK